VWSADGEPIVGQTGSTLTLSPEYVGKLISAQITLHETGFADLVTNAVGEVVYGSGPSSGGSMGYGGESIALPGCFAPRSEVGDAPVIGWPLFFNCNPYNTDFASPASQTFAWYRDGSLIAGESKSEYRLTNADSGKVIWATFRAVWANGFVFTEAKRMAAPAPYKIIARKPSIRGVFRAKGKLTAVTQGWDSSANLSYQWFSNYFPIDGANTRTYRLRATDLDKNVQVLVTATRPGYNPVSRVSDPVSNSDVPELSAYSAYKKVFGSYQATTTNYDLNYIVSPTVTPDALAHEQTLLQHAADFWAPQFTPTGQTIVFLTKDDITWAEALVAQHPNWSSGIPGGIRSWIENKNCGFALSFMDAQRQVFIQCVHLGTDHSLNDDSVSEHEYTHWFQYAQTPNLYSTVAPWLVEGQANFYGQALGIAPKDPELKYINNTLAGYATQWDIFNGYNFGDFRMLDILQAGDSFDTEILLDRFGMVWDEYYLGSLTSEWLIEHFGPAICCKTKQQTETPKSQ
jgi:hypothetical protein